MVNPTKRNIAGEIDKFNNEDLNFISKLLSSKKSQSKDNPTNDDLIVSLSDAYENKRARQVTEWESLRRRNIRRSAQVNG